jgi:hypothetical protein
MFQNRRYKIDFTPLYQSIQVFQVLGLADDFRGRYRENRKLQSENITRAKGVKEKGLNNYLFDVVGFFVVESNVAKTTKDIATPPSQLDKIWETLMTHIKVRITEQVSQTVEPATLLKLKNFVFLFATTMQASSYEVSQLFELFTNMVETFAELNTNQYSHEFIKILEQEKWEAAVISDPKEYEVLILKNKLQMTDSKK